MAAKRVARFALAAASPWDERQARELLLHRGTSSSLRLVGKAKAAARRTRPATSGVPTCHMPCATSCLWATGYEP
jgi:hypothetical protein